MSCKKNFYPFPGSPLIIKSDIGREEGKIMEVMNQSNKIT